MKTLPVWATRALALVVLSVTYLAHHQQWFPAGYRFHGIDLQGVMSTLAAAFAAVGLSGPALWPKLAALLGNPPAPVDLATAVKGAQQ
jgi:hypothetical protein